MITNSSRLTKRFFVSMICVAAVVGTVAAVAAVPGPEGAEARLLRQLLAAHPGDADLQQKAAALAPKLAAEASRLNAAKPLTADERRQMMADKSAAAAVHAAAAADEAARPSSDVVEPNPFLGIHDAAEVPNDFAADEFVPLTYWGGSLNGQPIGVLSGYRPSDPSHGVVVVMADKADPHGTFYEVPSPAPRIVAVTRDRVTLASASGRVQFDLAARRLAPALAPMP